MHLLTLDEALKEKKVRVHETGEVNELAVENLSKQWDIFIQSGDIVKGGQQDRLLACDLVVSAGSGKMPIPSFCVESDRWNQRENEDTEDFNSSTSQLASKRLKLAGGNLGGGAANLGVAGGMGGLVATRGSGAQNPGSFGGGGLGLGGLGGGGLGMQSGVWKEVGRFQKSLESQLGKNPRDSRSPSSLQLTVENKDVRTALGEYLKPLSLVIDDKKDVVGFVFAVNGLLNSAEIYASGELFRKRWPRLLDAAALEALTEFQEQKNSPRLTAAQVLSTLKAAGKGKPFEIGATDRIRIVMTETDQCFYFQTLDRKRQEASIHQSYLMKLIEPPKEDERQ
jgi:hypothetical protein